MPVSLLVGDAETLTIAYSIQCMIISRNITYNELFSSITNVYKDLFQFENYNKLKNRKNNTYKTIAFFSAVNSIKNLISCKLTDSDLFLLTNGILDTYFIVTASKGDNWKIENKEFIGATQKEINGKLLNQNQRENFLFSLNFQSWINGKKKFKPIKDLENSSEIQINRVCDFKIEADSNKYDLVECKRKYPSNPNSSFSEDRILQKIMKTLSDAKNQLLSTETFFVGKGELKANCKHLLIDITGYSETLSWSQNSFKICGFNFDRNIQPLIHRLLGKTISDIDQITLCWTNIIKNNDLIVAKTLNTTQVSITDKIPLFNYDGFTLETYPNHNNHKLISQFRISSTARSFSWIKASWYASTNQLVTLSKKNG
jgi:hypothetical protein